LAGEPATAIHLEITPSRSRDWRPLQWFEARYAREAYRGLSYPAALALYIGGSARQIEDVAALVRLHADALDQAYLDRWAAAIGLEPQWRQAQTSGGTG
jgi:hypothetical protein